MGYSIGWRCWRNDLLVMEYDKALDYLYSKAPMFQRVGAVAYKAGLERAQELNKLFGTPNNSYKTIHVGGTNGKGSVSHSLAAILQSAGYRVGLYTSPHLVDFRERIRVNGELMPCESVVDFMERYREVESEEIAPSFFELTMVMAFDYFRVAKVDYAIIEVGMGGRLDSTNIINPELTVITNISLDHTQFLGDTPEKIAAEKGGIIKANVPVVIGEAAGGVREVFTECAARVGTEICFAEDALQYTDCVNHEDTLLVHSLNYGDFKCELSGDCQHKNINTVLTAVNHLRELGVSITAEDVARGYVNVCSLTGLMGRWMVLNKCNPRVICDTGHNIGGVTYIVKQLERENCKGLRLVLGFVSDKDVTKILSIMPKTAKYYYVKAEIPRAMECGELAVAAAAAGLNGTCCGSVAQGYAAAMRDSEDGDLVFVGGSTFVVADLLSSL